MLTTTTTRISNIDQAILLTADCCEPLTVEGSLDCPLLGPFVLLFCEEDDSRCSATCRGHTRNRIRTAARLSEELLSYNYVTWSVSKIFRVVNKDVARRSKR